MYKILFYKENNQIILEDISDISQIFEDARIATTGGNLKEFKTQQEKLDFYDIPEGKEYDIVNDKIVIVDKSAQALQKEKQEKLKQDLAKIDAETQAKFTFFEFDGKNFSLSQNAQLNWGQLMSLKLAGWFGESQSITTYEDKEYTLTSEKVDTFMQTYAGAKMAILTEGRKKKEELINKK